MYGLAFRDSQIERLTLAHIVKIQLQPQMMTIFDDDVNASERIGLLNFAEGQLGKIEIACIGIPTIPTSANDLNIFVETQTACLLYLSFTSDR